VDLLPSQEQLELTGLAAEFFAEQIPVSRIRERRAEPSAITRETWTAAAELGLLGVSAPEDIGGLGLGLDDEVLLFREMGRQLVPGPFIASALGARLALLTGDAGLARKIVAGDAIVGLAQRRMGPERAAGGPLVGQFDLFDAADTDYLLLVEPSGTGLVETAAATDIQLAECIDPGTRLATLRADGVPVACWAPAEAEPLRLRGLALASAVLVGISQAVTDLAVEHAKNRVQFGRPIGVNQAIKHVCVDMAVATEAALQQTLFGAISLRSGRPDAEFQVMAAKVVSGRAAVDNAAHCIQVHGGMGYTDEHNAHLYLKRAHVLGHFFGSSRESLAAVLAAAPAG
jgi:alkylation response protein AidB-like acyl-CoA dehydrogenase